MKLSIITVTYNAEKTIRRTLDSVALQQDCDVEHIIVDGASRDGTMRIVEEYSKAATYDVKAVSEPDKGLYDAMNKGIALATGDYLVFLNAGDKLHSADVLQQLRQCDGAGIIYGDTAVVDDAGQMLQLRRLRPPKRLTWRSFRSGMLVCHQSFYVRRELAPQYDLQYRFSADFDWCIRCMKAAERKGLRLETPRCASDAGNAEQRFLIMTDYLSEGMTTANHKASLMERLCIMAKHYGWLQTIAMHLWFVVRSVK